MTSILRLSGICAVTIWLAGCGNGSASNVGGPSLATAVAGSSSSAAGDPGGPRVFWASQPVGPNETVLAATGNTDSNSTVEVALLPNGSPGTPNTASAPLQWQAASVLQASSTSVKFLIPASWPQGVYAYRIQSYGLSSGVALLNAPDIWFIQGDQGESATPGGWIQVHGTAIAAPGKNASVALVGNGQVVATLAPDASGNAYAQRFLIPTDVPPAKYQVYLHNGAGGTQAWTQFQGFIDSPIGTFQIATPVSWPSTVFDVSKQPGANDDARFAAAIAAAQANGGGVIYLPARTYSLSTQLNLPNRTVLRGAGKTTSIVQWTSTPADPARPGTQVQALVQGVQLISGQPGRAVFAIENLSLVGPADFSANAVDSEFSTDFGWLRQVSIILPNIGSYTAATQPTAIFLRARHNFEVTGSDLDAASDIFAREDVVDLRVEGNTLNWRDSTISLSGRSHAFIIAANAFNLRGTAQQNGWLAAVDPNPGFAFTSFFGTTIGGPYTRDLYYANNSSTRDQSELPPSYVGSTYDGSQGIYLGGISSVNGTSMTLKGSTLSPADGSTYNWTGAIAQILDGKGAGQWRYLTEAGPNQRVVSIDRPWDVEPDSSSVISLLNLQGRVLMVNNDFGQEQTNQEYYFAMDVVKAQNTYGVTGAGSNNLAWIGQHYQGLAPGWHYQLMDNQIVRGTRVNLASAVQTKTNGYAGVMGGYQVFRNNNADAAVPTSISIAAVNGRFSDVLVENNTVSDLNLGPSPTDPLDFGSVLLRRNHANLNGNLSGSASTGTTQILILP